MLYEGVAEVEPLVAARATVVVNGVTVVAEALGGCEKAVAVRAETVVHRALVVPLCV